jgi:hypothetical protein
MPKPYLVKAVENFSDFHKIYLFQSTGEVPYCRGSDQRREIPA